MVAPAMLKQAEEQAAKMPSVPSPIVTSSHPNLDLLDTLAALAAQKSPIHRKKIAWNDDMIVSNRDDSSPDSYRAPMRVNACTYLFFMLFVFFEFLISVCSP